MSTHLIGCCVVVCLLAVRAGGEARTLSSATDGNWEDASSWVVEASGENTVPTPEDTVVIGSHTIVMTHGEKVAGFHLNGGTLDLSTHDLTTDGKGSSWQKGLITGSGGFINQGPMSLADTPTKTLQGVFNNRSEVSHLDDGNLNLAYASVWINEDNSLYDLQSDADITGLARWDATPKFVNHGTVRKSGGEAISRVEVAFHNIGGTIEVESGKLSLAGTIGIVSTSSNGTFTVAQDAVLDLGGDNVNVFNGTYVGAGEGRIEFNRGTMRVGTDFDNTRFQFTGGGFFWNGGCIAPDLGGLVNEGRFTLTGAGVKNLATGPAFQNLGTVVHQGDGNLNIEYGGLWENQPGSVYELAGNAGVSASGGEGPTPTFCNRGVFRKTGGDGIATIRTKFMNRGNVEILSGTLNFTDSYMQTGGVTRLSGGNLAASHPVHIQTGEFAGSGRVFASVYSSGKVAPGSSAGILRIDGNYVQGRDGYLDIELGGTEPGDLYDQLRVMGDAVLDGTLGVTLLEDFVPSVGDEFKIIQSRTRFGEFKAEELPALSADRAWNLRYTDKAVYLSVIHP